MDGEAGEPAGAKVVLSYGGGPVIPAAGGAEGAGGQEQSVHCPLCEYDLRGLTEPRCPECGYRFEWAELTDPARRRHPYLFEHHPERNVRSFADTLLGGLRPRKFWSTLYPTQRSRPWRLVAYFVLVCLTALLPAVVGVARDAQGLYSDTMAARASYLRLLQIPGTRAQLSSRYPGLTAQQIVDRIVPLPSVGLLLQRVVNSRRVVGVWLLVLSPLVWVVLSAAAMMIFRFSMKRARVRPIHALRCVVYSGDVVAWLNLILAAVLVAAFVRNWGSTTARSTDEFIYGPLACLLLLGSWFVFAYRFTIALRRYLRFDHVVATVAATQVIVLLSVLVAFVILFSPY